MDHADPRLERLVGRGEANGAAVHEHRPLVAARLRDDRHTEQDVHQSGLSRAVLAHEPQDLPGPEREAHVGEHPVSVVFFPDVLQFQEECIGQTNHL